MTSAVPRTALHLDNAWTDGLLSRLSNITLQKSNVTEERVMAWIEVFWYFSPGTCQVNTDNLPLEQGEPGNIFLVTPFLKH